MSERSTLKMSRFSFSTYSCLLPLLGDDRVHALVERGQEHAALAAALGGEEQQEEAARHWAPSSMHRLGMLTR